MTQQEIDAALTAWNRRLTAMADNLMSLQSESAYRMLTGSGGSSKLQIKGETLTRVERPLAAMRVSFEYFDLLHSTIDRAAKIRESLPALFGIEEKLAEIQRLLFGRSIELPTASVTFDQRTLLSGAQNNQRLTPEELIAGMAKTYADARDAVLAVDRAWQEIASRILAAETQLRQFETRYWATGCGMSPAISTALKSKQDLLKDLSEMLRSDPLGALSRTNVQLEPAISRFAGIVEAAERVHAELQQSRADLDLLFTLHREASAAHAEALAKISDCQPLPAPIAQDRLDRLRDWLTQLDRRWCEGAVDTVSAGLRNWHQSAQAALGEDTKARDASRSAVDSRRELHGRLDALKAKARAMGVAERDAITAIATDAEALLSARPTDMAKAMAAVVAYAQALHAARREA